MSHKTTQKKQNKTLNPPMCVYLSITGQKTNKQTQKRKQNDEHSRGLAGRPLCHAELLSASAACRRYIRCQRQVATRPDPGIRLSSWGLGSGSCPGALAWSTPHTWALP